MPFALNIFEKGCHGLSTADSAAFPDGVPEISTDLPRWLDMAITWLGDRGFSVCG